MITSTKVDNAALLGDLDLVKKHFAELTFQERGHVLVLACNQARVEVPLYVLSEGVQGMSPTDLDQATVLAGRRGHQDVLNRLNDLGEMSAARAKDAVIGILIVFVPSRPPAQEGCLRWLMARVDPIELLEQMLDNYDSYNLDYEGAVGLMDSLSGYLGTTGRKAWIKDHGEGLFPCAAECERALLREGQLRQVSSSSTRARPRA